MNFVVLREKLATVVSKLARWNVYLLYQSVSP
jgi:hypothetical protein